MQDLAQIYIYYQDRESGYSESSTGPWYKTFKDMAAAQGWDLTVKHERIAIVYADQAN